MAGIRGSPAQGVAAADYGYDTLIMIPYKARQLRSLDPNQPTLHTKSTDMGNIFQTLILLNFPSRGDQHSQGRICIHSSQFSHPQINDLFRRVLKICFQLPERKCRQWSELSLPKGEISARFRSARYDLPRKRTLLANQYQTRLARFSGYTILFVIIV